MFRQSRFNPSHNCLCAVLVEREHPRLWFTIVKWGGGGFCAGFVALIVCERDFQWNETRQVRDWIACTGFNPTEVSRMGGQRRPASIKKFSG